MDSQDYFIKAQKSDKIYRRVMVAIGLCVTIALAVTLFILFRINQDQHKLGVENQQTINSNFDGYVKCLVDSSYNTPPATTKAEVNAELDKCAQANTSPLRDN
jgi:hypothetical protein